MALRQRSQTRQLGVTVFCVLLLMASCTGNHSTEDSSTKGRSGGGASGQTTALIPPRTNAYPPPNIAALPTNELWDDYVNTGAVRRNVLVSLKAPADRRGFYNGRVLISADTYESEKHELLNSLRGVVLSRDRPIELANGADLPMFQAEVASEADLKALVSSPFVDYVEPAPIELDLASDNSLACRPVPYVPSTAPREADGRLAGPYQGEDLIPYAYNLMHVEEAWRRFAPSKYARPFPGQGQGIAILDTGVASTQSEFFDNYTAYYPRGHFLRMNETDASIDDRCGHGTKVASIAGAPRDGRSVVGIAWDSTLMSFKVTDSPAPTHGSITLAEWVCKGIEHAVRPPDGQAPAKVVAMVFGTLWTIPSIQECIANAYQRSPSTIFIAAAGTKEPKVVFPASLDEYVVAISMVDLDSSGSGYRQLPYGQVAYGPSVDFVAAYSHDVQLPAAGMVNSPSAGVDEVLAFCCSSAATAIYAGILGLASQYAEEQAWSRDQLMTALRLSSSMREIRSHDSGEPSGVGAGLLDTYLATGGARNAVISAPSKVEAGQTVELSASVDAVIPPGARAPRHFKYTWSVNGGPSGTGAVLRLRAPDSGPVHVLLQVEDLIDGKALETRRDIEVVAHVEPAQHRTLYWDSYVSDYATFLNGGRYDHVVNSGILMPPGCTVSQVLGLAMERNDKGEIRAAANARPVESLAGKGAGFTIMRPAGIPQNSLETLVHQWHDGFSAVRTKVVYEVDQPAGFDCSTGTDLIPNP